MCVLKESMYRLEESIRGLDNSICGLDESMRGLDNSNAWIRDNSIRGLESNNLNYSSYFIVCYYFTKIWYLWYFIIF